jgi:hypothetical protein
MVKRQVASGEARKAFVKELPFCLRGVTGHEARGRDRSRIHHRVSAAIAAPLDGRQRVEGKAGAVHAELLAGRARTEQLTHEGEHERFGDAHDRELVVRVPGDEDRTTGTDDTHAEEVTRHLRKSRVHLGGFPFLI